MPHKKGLVEDLSRKLANCRRAKNMSVTRYNHAQKEIAKLKKEIRNLKRSYKTGNSEEGK